MYVSRNIEERSCNQFSYGGAISIIQSECVCVSVALGIQHAMRVRHTVLSYVSRVVLTYFLALSH